MSDDSTLTRNTHQIRDLLFHPNRLLDKFSISHLVLISIALHLFVIPFPQDSPVFDETYYTKAGLELLNGIASNPEHPFLGKLWGSLGITAFGNNWFGWRIPSVIFGALTLIAFYKFANLFLNSRRSLYASILLSFDNIFFIHSSLYLLEIPALFFSIAAFYFYFTKKYKISALMMGLAILSKETSFFFLVALAIYHITIHIKSRHDNKTHSLTYNSRKTDIRKTAIFLLTLLAVTAAPLWIYDITYQPAASTKVVVIETVEVDNLGSIIGTTYKSETKKAEIIDNPLTHVLYILQYQSGLKISDSDTIDQNHYAWNWILPLPPKEMVYYDVAINKNISIYQNDKLTSSKIITTHPIHWAGIGNLPLWIIGFWLIIPVSIIAIIYRQNIKFSLMILTWIIFTYGPYLYISFVVQRIVYPFYFINTIPALALGLAALGQYSKNNKFTKYFQALLLIAIVVWFFWFFPVRILEF